MYLLALGLLALPILSHPTINHVRPRQTSSGPEKLCGAPDAYEVINDTPWIVYSMNYNYDLISGSCCTNFNGLVTNKEGEQKCSWSSVWDIADDSNSDIVKGYSFVGLTQNLETRISDIDSIPATYRWRRSNETAYKGNVVFDFMTSDTKGDSTSTAAQELMLWLRYEGGQIPIGYNSGPVSKIDGLYGKSWTLYQGVNEDTGIAVSSLLLDEADQYYGWFSGDIKDWLLKMVDEGLFSESTFVNVGNAGMEPYITLVYGRVTFENRVGLQINLK